ncbi:SUMF1/EgtB/PvdO family nonheme iron enzyme [Zooshikella sp. RANM57]|uniref:SUMF1/EgtB/PvdO family nonheme iron enzyme n=1 Tax=Zooshikella sp. RANM57 TaxID=3425863 RepID=UPI003D6E596A
MLKLNNYTLLSLIAGNDRKKAYYAIDRLKQRYVIVKVINPSNGNQSKLDTTLFKKNAALTSDLIHPHIISIYDYGFTSSNFPYLAMEYCDNGNLTDKIQEGLTLDKTLQILQQIANALTFVHKAHIIHGQLKPNNILFRSDGSVVLSDFNNTSLNTITKRQSAAFFSSSYTPEYMSPEQARRVSFDSRSDLYSLGIICYEMLLGFPPFRGDSPLSVSLKHLNSTVPQLPEKYRGLQLFLNQLLAKNPLHRFQTAKEVSFALRQLQYQFLEHGHLRAAPPENRASAPYIVANALPSPNEPQKQSAGKSYLIAGLVLTIPGILLLNNNGLKSDTPHSSNEQEHSVMNQNSDIVIRMPLIINVTPKDATIQFNHSTQSFHQGMLLASGHYSLSITKPGYQSQQVEIHHNKQIPTQLNLTLSPALYSVHIKAHPPGSTIRIINIKPKYTKNLQLPPGRYLVEVSHPGYQAKRQWLEIKSSTIKQTINLSPAMKQGKILQHSLAKGGYGPKMVVIPKGRFRMGDNDGMGSASEKPLHWVNLANDFAMSQYEITQTDFAQFIKETGYVFHNKINKKDNKKPITHTSWHDAQAYAQWISKQTGYTYRLPSEAEWEYAARAGGYTRFVWGNQPRTDNANCLEDCWENPLKGLLKGSQTLPVGQYPANDFQLFDMAGNVAEWTLDCYQNSYRQHPADGRPVNKAHCSHRVIRGGSFTDPIENLRIARRAKRTPAYRDEQIGFRLVLELKR